jgi:hypothetical protein
MRRFRFAALQGNEMPGGALIVAPLVLIAAIPTVDLALPPDIHLAPMLAVAPAFTVAFAGHRLTALIGALAVTAQVVAGLERGTLTTEAVVVEVVSLAVLSALLVLFCYLRERREREMHRMRLVSEAARQAVLRPLPARAGSVSIASEYRTAEGEAGIGGDLFAVARTTGSTRLLIGDVRGKGLSSIGDTTIMLGAFRAAAHRQAPLAELVAYLEGSVHWGLAELSGTEEHAGERFVTALIVDIPDNEPVIHVVSCGHPPPLLLRHRAATSLVVPHPAPPLGLGGLSDTSYAPETFPFSLGDLLLLYTDGASEARNGEGAFYPLAERAAAWAADGPDALLKKIMADLLPYSGGALDDDMAMIAIQRGEPSGDEGAPHL